MTICSNALCFNRAEETNDPSHPPFCEKCKAKSQKALAMQKAVQR